ncbi:hypothetical protein J3458_005114 [Metarhizium acridum]|uniref:Extracellular serine-rich protein n=1 Tax=Metarhizium acridum (strain CQMa 102) TaxID=655827 RepID=E9E194_METAQ|nr:extracellular serine-rich protein [Metarhizium acridum CQMa 102]EFY90396.1 extracellular serine-rich protein [Metarhizium acridum CQMa 102]KAG8417620.1 hypothetical protein J3458_005114 [Metarhizium acridum]
MQFTTLALATLLSVAQASVQVHKVDVGKNPLTNETALKFYPDKITAKPGDMVQFQFWVGNHNAMQTTFDQQCQPISKHSPNVTGFDSGFQPAQASLDKGLISVYTVKINSTAPIWVACVQGRHCQDGMSMVINENTSANSSRSLENYRLQAKSAQSSAGTPGGGSNGGSGNNGGESSTPGSGDTPTPVGNQSPTTSAPLSAGINLAVPSTLLIALGVGFMFL